MARAAVIKNELKYFPMSEGYQYLLPVLLHFYQMTTNSAVNRNSASVMNN